MPELKLEQKTAIQHDNGNILVSASAGSGKTFVMIERLIRLIREQKTQVSEVLAVTFTESAAADMKEKLKRELAKSVQKGERKLARVIAEVDTADISTLHAFCGRLIRKYFFVVGCTNGNKIVPICTIIKVFKPWVFSFFKFHFAHLFLQGVRHRCK